MTTKPISHQLTLRDRLCLTWIALQYAIRFDQLQQLLYRHTPEADRSKLKPGTDRLSLDRTYDLINKWLALGLIEKDPILHREKVWIWVSREGLRELDLAFNYSGKPASSRIPHLYYINQIRLAIEAKRPHDHWQSERQLLKERPALVKGQHVGHTPDAILTNGENGKVTALEIERSSKTEDELLDALLELAGTYTSIWYFASSATKRQIEAKLEAFDLQTRKPFRIYSLIEYGGIAYGIS